MGKTYHVTIIKSASFLSWRIFFMSCKFKCKLSAINCGVGHLQDANANIYFFVVSYIRNGSNLHTHNNKKSFIHSFIHLEPAAMETHRRCVCVGLQRYSRESRVHGKQVDLFKDEKISWKKSVALNKRCNTVNVLNDSVIVHRSPAGTHFTLIKVFSGRYLPEYGPFRTLGWSWIRMIWRWRSSPAAEWIMLPLRWAPVSFPFSPSHHVWKMKGRYRSPPWHNGLFTVPHPILKQLISAGLLSFCQLLISGLPHLSRLQPLNLRLLPPQPFSCAPPRRRHTSAIRSGQTRRSRTRPEERLLTLGAAALISDGSKRRFGAAAVQPREAVCRQKIKWLLVSVNHSRNP